MVDLYPGDYYLCLLLCLKNYLFFVKFFFFLGVFSSPWSACWGGKSLVSFIDGYPDAELRTAKNGQFVKVSGV